MDPDLLDAEFEAWNGVQPTSRSDGGAGALDQGGSFKASSEDPQRAAHEQVLWLLREVKDPDIGRDVVTLGFVRDLEIQGDDGMKKVVKLSLRLTTPACPFKGQIKKEAEAAIRKLPWVKEVDVTLDSVRDFHAASTGRPPNLKKVGFIVGVASCKGGCGKSTVCLSLALMLRRSGAKVGVLDADIYGPSLPTLLQMEESKVRFAAEGEADSECENERETRRMSPVPDRRGRAVVRRTRIEYEEPSLGESGTHQASKAPLPGIAADEQMSMLPVVVSGIKCMSYGFIVKEKEQGYSALRGPFVSSVVEQLLTGTKWGSLDYLLIDLPPGTGDIHITLTQQAVPLDGCVVVTTPQRLRRHELFGPPDATQQLAELSAARHLLLLPLDPRLNAANFAGSPLPHARDSFVDLAGPEDPVWQQLRALADRVVRELSTIRFGSLKPQASVTPDGSAMIVALVRPTGALAGEAAPLMVKEVFEIPGEVLRKRCRCEECAARQKGGVPLRVTDGETCIAKLIETQEEAVEIIWAGGHESRFSHAELVGACRQLRLAAVNEEGL